MNAHLTPSITSITQLNSGRDDEQSELPRSVHLQVSVVSSWSSLECHRRNKEFATPEPLATAM